MEEYLENLANQPPPNENEKFDVDPKLHIERRFHKELLNKFMGSTCESLLARVFQRVPRYIILLEALQKQSKWEKHLDPYEVGKKEELERLRREAMNNNEKGGKNSLDSSFLLKSSLSKGNMTSSQSFDPSSSSSYTSINNRTKHTFMDVYFEHPDNSPLEKAHDLMHQIADLINWSVNNKEKVIEIQRNLEKYPSV